MKPWLINVVTFLFILFVIAGLFSIGFIFLTYCQRIELETYVGH